MALQTPLTRPWRADVALVLVTVVWGSTFIIVKQALDAVGPFVFVAARFWLAGAALLMAALVRRETFSRRVVRDGVLTGLCLTVGFVTQTLGLQTTEAGKAAFITGLSVVLVPPCAALLLRQPPSRAATLGVLLATVGLGLLPLERTLRLAPGDLWVLACAVGFAGHILSTGAFSPRHAVLPFTLVQLLTVAGLTSLAALVLEARALVPPPGAWLAIGYMGLVATACVFGVQSWAQHHTSPTHTALIFALEPVFAALFAIAIGGEMLASRQWLGGGLILLGMVAAELGGNRDA